MQAEPIGDKYMLCPFQIQMCDLQGGIALGTAFFYNFQTETFIITNWHNVTGKNPWDGESLHRGRSPSYIQAKWPVGHTDATTDNEEVRWHFEVQKIDIEDANGPIWFEHPALGSYCDVVAIPANRPHHWPASIHMASNKIDEVPVPVDVGMKVMVIGFPHAISTGPGLPLMKTGFLSSLPGQELRIEGEFSEVGGNDRGYHSTGCISGRTYPTWNVRVSCILRIYRSLESE